MLLMVACGTAERFASPFGVIPRSLQRPLIRLAMKRRLAGLPLTLFPIHGNHEQRPGRIPSYHTVLWNGGGVYVEDEFPYLLFAADGFFFSFDGVQTFVMGGAYSVDKDIRLARNWGWWPDDSRMLRPGSGRNSS